MEQGRPQVMMWVKVYEGAFAAMYALLAVLGVVFLVADIPRESADLPPQVMGVIFLVVSLPLAAVFAAALFVPQKPWAWIFHLVLIVIGLTSPCCIPASLPLLIFWLKPEVKAAFGRT